MKTNVFLNEKVKKKGLTVKEFAGMVEISESYAKVLLAPGSKNIPSDKIGYKIIKVLEFDKEEEKEFWRLVEEDRKELEGEPGSSEPEPSPEMPGIEDEEIRKDIKRLDLALDECKKWVHGVEETLWKYKEEDRAWGGMIEERLRGVENVLEKINKEQKTSITGIWKWIWILGIGMAVLYFVIAGMLRIFR